MASVRSYLPILRTVAILVDVVSIIAICGAGVAAAFLPPYDRPPSPVVVIFGGILLAVAANLATILLVKPDPEERQLEADVRKAELRKRLRELNESNQRSQ